MSIREKIKMGRPKVQLTNRIRHQQILTLLRTKLKSSKPTELVGETCKMMIEVRVVWRVAK